MKAGITGNRSRTPQLWRGQCGSADVLFCSRLCFGLATVMTAVNALPSLPAPVPRTQAWDRQGWSTLLAGALLLLISFTTNYGDDNLSQLGNLAVPCKVGMGLYLAALAALADDVQLATRLRHRALNEAIRTERARQLEADMRERKALDAAAREQRQNRALRAGTLFLLEPSPLHRRFLAYIAIDWRGHRRTSRRAELGLVSGCWDEASFSRLNALQRRRLVPEISSHHCRRASHLTRL